MNEPKAFASLTSSLLARKGGARPAMRRQVALGDSGNHDDLGWNDMGDGHSYESPSLAATGLTPMPQVAAPVFKTAEADAPAPIPPVVEQRRELAEKIATPAAKPVRAAKVSPAKARSAKAAFTLRLDPERHLRLRLACAVGNRSAQQIVTDALDAFLDSRPEIDALADRVTRGAKKN
ncbi:MAG: hypothetical protein ACO1NM_05595 [Sphingobium phenoxybenzoativorans]